jgi:hypothetical protein
MVCTGQEMKHDRLFSSQSLYACAVIALPCNTVPEKVEARNFVQPGGKARNITVNRGLVLANHRLHILRVYKEIIPNEGSISRNESTG